MFAHAYILQSCVHNEGMYSKLVVHTDRQKHIDIYTNRTWYCKRESEKERRGERESQRARVKER
jgi:hypothetical protein